MVILYWLATARGHHMINVCVNIYDTYVSTSTQYMIPSLICGKLSCDNSSRRSRSYSRSRYHHTHSEWSYESYDQYSSSRDNHTRYG